MAPLKLRKSSTESCFGAGSQGGSLTVQVLVVVEAKFGVSVTWEVAVYSSVAVAAALHKTYNHPQVLDEGAGHQQPVPVPTRAVEHRAYFAYVIVKLHLAVCVCYPYCVIEPDPSPVATAELPFGETLVWTYGRRFHASALCLSPTEKPTLGSFGPQEKSAQGHGMAQVPILVWNFSLVW